MIIINYFVFMFCILLVCGAMSSFYSENILLGVLLVLLIPIIIFLEIYCCLKFTKTTISDHYKLANKKYGSDNVELFTGMLVLIPVVILMIVLCVYAANNQH